LQAQHQSRSPRGRSARSRRPSMHCGRRGANGLQSAASPPLRPQSPNIGTTQLATFHIVTGANRKWANRSGRG
jgi:hypothetical protein